MMKVFVVDDSPLIRERLWAMLAEIPGIKVIDVHLRLSFAQSTI